jgi:hypothetical protein
MSKLHRTGILSVNDRTQNDGSCLCRAGPKLLVALRGFGAASIERISVH